MKRFTLISGILVVAGFVIVLPDASASGSSHISSSPLLADPMTAITALALLLLPVLAGAFAGKGIKRLRGRRLAGVTVGLACFLLPVAAALALWYYFPVVGLWDAPVEGLLAGLGLFIGVHRAMSDRRNVILLIGSMLAGAVVLEVGCRVLLPRPPGFPVGGGVHFLLRNALQVEPSLRAWDTYSKDFVCAGVYGPDYRRMFAETSREGVITPQSWVPRRSAREHVLHMGDSMAFGFGVARDKTFTALLERLEPEVEHVNGAVPGTAPDSYYALISKWVRERHPDRVVMYVYEANDLDGLDSDFPCCGFTPLLSYESESAVRLHCPKPTSVEFRKAGLEWLRAESPPPFLARVVIDVSAAAAWLSGALMIQPYMLRFAPKETQLAHLKAILATTRDELKSQGVPFLIVVLPAESWVQDGKTWQHYGPKIIEVIRQLGIRTLDASEPFLKAEAAGPTIFNQGCHFSEHGHEVVADWLHKNLAGAFGQ